MGQSISQIFETETSEQRMIKQRVLYQKALTNYHNRLKSYNQVIYLNPSLKMSYFDYQEWCRQQYELELLPEDVRYGSNYTGDD